MPRIVVESGPQRGKIYSLPESEVRVGRDANCSFQVSDARVSRVHFTLTKRGKSFVLTDRSRNGTFVNGTRVEARTLRQGDMIRLGHTFLSYFEEHSDPFIGKTVAGYRIDHRLGRGAMGTVYRAVQVSLDRTVALKILSGSLTDDEAFVKQFLEECRSVGKLNHPNVVQIHDAGYTDELFYISMEYMAGGSFQALMDREGRLAPARVLRWMIDASKALIWAEDHGIVHRDIKPDNLMLDNRGVMKLGDFGIAADNRRSKTLMEGGKVVGTPLYMAPEQAMGKPVDHRVDIYALGSTMYTALSGQFPYDGENSTEILVKKCKERPLPLGKVAPDLPRRVVTVVERMMAMKPDDRYRSARDMLIAISGAYDYVRAHDGGGSSSSATGVNTAIAQPGTGTTKVVPGTAWKQRLLYTALIVSGLILIGIVVWSLL